MSLTIVTASLNAYDNLALMYESIRGLLSENIEWIICDSIKSVDLTSTYFCSKAFVKVYSVDDCGIYDAINQGISAARGDWILVLGSDDLVFPCIVHLLSDFDSDELIYALPYTLGNSTRVYRRCPTSIFHFLRGMPLSHQCLLINRVLCSKFPYDISFKYASDYHWLLNAFLRGYRPVKSLSSFPVVNMGLSGVSSSRSLRILIAKEFLTILRSLSLPFYFYIPLLLSICNTRFSNYFSGLPRAFRHNFFGI